MNIRFFSESLSPNGWENSIRNWARIFVTEEDFEEDDSSFNTLTKVKKNNMFDLFENEYANNLTDVAYERIKELAKDKKIIALLNCSDMIFGKIISETELDVYAVKTSENRMLYYAYYEDNKMIVHYAFNIA